eukprot:COSAG01_NODE_2262_length_8049_cov_29.953213_5_plen_34_part_00
MIIYSGGVRVVYLCIHVEQHSYYTSKYYRLIWV